ncbi:hypothetical protein IT415_04090 [bacterium]|nr:hypothetical protein [bacterium]
MARSKQTQLQKDDIDQAARVAQIFSSSELIELINNRWRFAWINLRAGFYRGVGTTLGIALVVVLIGYLVIILGGVPYIGDFIKSIDNSVPTSTQVK